MFIVIFIRNIDLLIKAQLSPNTMKLLQGKSRFRRHWSKFDDLSVKQKIQIFYDILRELDPVRIALNLDDATMRRQFIANLMFLEKLISLQIDGEIFDMGYYLIDVPSKGRFKLKVRICLGEYINLQEGEFLLQFLCDDAIIHFITFSIFKSLDFKLGHGDLILVGGIQGCHTEFHDLRSQVIRDCYDIAPEDILLLVLTGLARGFGVEYILGVSSGIHSAQIFNWRIEKIREQLYNCYDYFWLRHSAKRHNNYFLLNELDEPVSNTQIRCGHKKRKQIKRNIKTEIMNSAEIITSGNVVKTTVTAAHPPFSQ